MRDLPDQVAPEQECEKILRDAAHLTSRSFRLFYQNPDKEHRRISLLCRLYHRTIASDHRLTFTVTGDLFPGIIALATTMRSLRSFLKPEPFHGA